MDLSTLIRSECNFLRRYEFRYRLTRDTEPAFEAYADLTALLEAVAPESPLTIEQRQPVLRAIVLQQQSRHHPLWAALLMRAFEPLLVNFWHRGKPASFRNVGDREDFTQQVVATFLEVIGSVKVDGSEPVFAVVRRETARRLFGEVRAARETPGETIAFDELAAECAPSPHVDADPFTHLLAREVAGLMADTEGGAEVALTLAGAETLREQAERLGATDDVTYERLKKRRQRAIEHVRAEVSGKRGR